MAINENTHTEVLEEKGDKKHKFLVTCGSTGKEYIMCADDSRTRNEWLLDIAKVMKGIYFYVLFLLNEMGCFSRCA